MKFQTAALSVLISCDNFCSMFVMHCPLYPLRSVSTAKRLFQTWRRRCWSRLVWVLVAWTCRQGRLYQEIRTLVDIAPESLDQVLPIHYDKERTSDGDYRYEFKTKHSSAESWISLSFHKIFTLLGNRRITSRMVRLSTYAPNIVFVVIFTLQF